MQISKLTQDDYQSKLVSPSRSSGGKGKGKRGDKGKGGQNAEVFFVVFFFDGKLRSWRKFEFSSWSLLCGVLVKFKFSLLDLNFLLVPTPTWMSIQFPC